MELAEKVLLVLSDEGSSDSLKLSSKLNEDHQKIVGAIKSLESLGNVVKTETKAVKKFELTKEGAEVAERGSHEAVVYGKVPKEGIDQPTLMKQLTEILGGASKVGFSKAMSLGWIAIDKSAGAPKVTQKADKIDDEVQKHLAAFVQGKGDEVPDKVRDEYKKRKLMVEATVKYYEISKGSNFSTTIQKAETELTPEMLANGSWKSLNFKPYNFDALGIQPMRGHLHPLMKVRAEYRQIFLEMGFSEMPTNNFVESSFWNFDALFQPQQHPARDAHDTFFISDPADASTFPMDYLEKVKTVHSTGGFGSQGYGYDWKIEEAKKNLLRTHTTAVSARMLYALAQDYKKEGMFRPQKYFSIDRVFRNETLDATHLAEFHQIEGLVADRNLTLGNLLGVISEFFKKLGIKKLRFKPAYNPYTEPSMEIFSYHEGLKKWVEIGNSGIFRPEMLLPMGLPDDVNVIAWGLSLERPTMIKYGIDNIRDLVGHKVNLRMVQENPICRLDKEDSSSSGGLIRSIENRWTRIESQLDYLSARVEAILHKKGIAEPEPSIGASPNKDLNRNLVIWADPLFPPYSIPILCSALSQKSSVFSSEHVHSSVNGQVPEHLQNFLSSNASTDQPRSKFEWKVTLIWKNVGRDPVLILSPLLNQAIHGECNIGRYFSRCLDESSTFVYESLPLELSVMVDSWIDTLHAVQHGSAHVRDVTERIKSKSSLVPELPSKNLPDLLLASICKQGCRSELKELSNWQRKFWNGCS